MSLGAQTGARGNEALGLLLGLTAATVYAGSVLLQKVVLRDLDAVRAIWLGCVFGTLALLPFGPALVTQLPGADPAAGGGAIYLGIVSTAVAFSTWAFALRRMPAGRIGPLVGYLVTVVAVLMSWAFLAEVPSATAIVGGSA
jgi:drug/metabolite transporter (DMT)-like permease